MKTSDFFYDLPQQLIAQHPLEQRDSSRLMLLDRLTGETLHKYFYDIEKELMPSDCLILNDSKVIPARIYGKRVDTGAVVEFLLLNRLSEHTWEALAGPGKKAKIGTQFTFGSEAIDAKVISITADGSRVVEFNYHGNFYDILDEIGTMPLPHYITERLDDKDRYQTVYARDLGSKAAPTAGFHFTEQLLDRLQVKGVKVGFVTLHVGLGTFRPVKAQEISDHKMHAEYYEIPEKTADLIKKTKSCGGRVIAVGTTSCRTLESMYKTHGEIKACGGFTDIFIYPGYEFKIVDAIVTNFHLPESTLIMLVSAFAGHEHTMPAYREAVKEQYRFFSFGDSMFIS